MGRCECETTPSLNAPPVANDSRSIFFLLYFNRLFASIVSWALRTWTWHNYRIYLDIQAIQISLLGGRIFFTGLRYHGNNETIFVQYGHITWAYWLRRVREVDFTKAKDARREGDGVGNAVSEKLPSRMKVSLTGLEWFVYNRSPAYDSILAGLTEVNEEKSDKTADVGGINGLDGVEDTAAKLRRRRSNRVETSGNLSSGRFSANTMRSSLSEANIGSPPNATSRNRTMSMHSSNSSSSESQSSDAPDPGDSLPLFLHLLPIQLECDKAAMVLGNENTKAILVVKAQSMSGDIDASETETVDPYRQLFRFKFQHPVIEMKENQDFREEQADRATREKLATRGSVLQPKRPAWERQAHGLFERLQSLIPFRRKLDDSASIDSGREIGTAASQIPGSDHWQGLSRYLHDDDGDDQKARWASSEYAAVRTILDSPEAVLVIFWDVVSRVRDPLTMSAEKPRGLEGNINGEEPPAWAIHLSVKGGSVNYGPWADRQRVDLQRVFVPNLCKDAVPAPRLAPGAFRVPTQFKLYVELDDAVSIRIPVREESKNWKWKGQEPVPNQPHSREGRKSRGRSKKPSESTTVHQRQYGWLDIKVTSNATISYTMDMVASTSGYSNSLSIDLPSTEISSSINHEILWRSGPLRITCDLSNPLRWNALRQWHFNVFSNRLELFLLREHVFLLTDLVDDWATGPPSDYFVFTPFKYYLNLQLQDFRLFLNLNDANIINNPTDLEDNTYFIVSSPLIHSKLCIPIDTYRPRKNAIPFDVRAETASVDLHVPSWNTQASFLPSKEVGHLENLSVNGTYNYNMTAAPANIDTLILNISGQSPVAYLHGFVIRYCMKAKDNYFGEDLHFRTMEEYQEMLRIEEHDPEASNANKPPPKKTSDMDVILSIRADDPKIYLPANLYSSSRHVQIDTACLSLDLRFTNYYMELELAIAPLNLSLGTADSGADTPIHATSSTQLFIDGINIYGHRLFGLPPTEPTYLCNWDLAVGTVSGECTTEFLTTLIRGGSSFGFTFDDDENALIPASSIILYDVTFLRVSVQSVDLWLHVEDAAFLFSTGPINVNFNDWARSHYSKRASIKIPNIKVLCVNAESAARHRTRSHHPVKTDALLETGVSLAVIGRKYDFTKERKLQQGLVRHEDQRTNRTAFLLLPDLPANMVWDPVDPPAQSVPPVPLPATSQSIGDDKATVNSVGTSKRSRGLRHKSSFLSLTGSDQSSIVRPHSSRLSNMRVKTTDRSQNPTALRNQPSAVREHHSHTREVSASTRHSAFYSASADYFERQDMSHNTVAFSSQFFAPYFPLESVRPDTKGTTMGSIESDNSEQQDSNSVDFDLGDIDPNILDEDSAYSSILLEMPKGVDAFCNPKAVRSIVTLLNSLQPSDPEDILDSVQIDSMKEIFGMQADQKMKGRVQDILVRLPRANVRFINSVEADYTGEFSEEQDQYKLEITKLALASRVQTRWQDAFKPDTREGRSSFHVRLGSAQISAAERYHDTENFQAAVLGRIESVVASLGTRDVSYLDVDVGSIQGSISSEKIDYLAPLIHRTSTLASDLGHLLEDATSRPKNMTRCLVRHLVCNGKETPDPAFLVRPSAVLRSAPQHLRTFDSWKLVMRLRQLWSIQTPFQKEETRLACFNGSNASVPRLREKVTAVFEKWRSWDLGNLSESVLLNSIFGPAGSSKQSTEEPPFLVVARVGQLQLLLDPGPKQNEINIVDVTARVEAKSAGPSPETTERMTVLNISCGDGAINLNWELCELAGSLTRLAEKMQSGLATRPDKVAAQAVKKKGQKQTIHCVLSLNRGSITLEAINLHVTSFSNGLRASLLLQMMDGDIADTNLILDCDSVTSSLRSHSQGLLKLILEKPSVFISHELQKTQTVNSHTIKTAASSRFLSLVVKQDPINLAEIIDLVVRDEITQLYRLKKQLITSTRSTSPAKKIVDKLSAFRVNVAMFMDQYTISLPLLRSLTYTVNGTVSRIAMAANFGREIIFDFDIKENSHEMQTKVNNTARSISLLQIPPTNGRVRSHMNQGEHNVSIFASLELVQLDASAVYSLLSALNRPEISNAINELQMQGKAIQDHIEELIGTSQPPPQASTDKEASILAYTVNLTFAGLKVFGNSPLQSTLAPMAHVSFALDSIHLGVANRVEQHGPTLEYPEININLRHIDFEIQRGRSPDDMDSCGNISFAALITAGSKQGEDEAGKRFFNVKSDAFEVNLSPDTVSTVVDVLGHMGDKIKDLDTSRELEYLRKLRQSKPRIAINDTEQEEDEEPDIIDTFLSSFTYTLQICNIQIAWLVVSPNEDPGSGKEDLVLSLQKIEFGTRTRNSARLTIENLQLQMVSPPHNPKLRSPNSALLPEIVFNIAYVSTSNARRLAFQAVGKSLDIRLTSGFIIPGAHLNDSITLSIKNVQRASQNWDPITSPTVSKSSQNQTDQPENIPQRNILGSRRLESLLVDADFAGAVVHLTGKKTPDDLVSATRAARPSHNGKQPTQDEPAGNVTLRSPGLAWKIEYSDNGNDPSLYAEVKIDASSNILHPSVVPLIRDISNSVKKVVSSRGDSNKPLVQTQQAVAKIKPPEEDSILTADPTAVLGRMKLNLGLRIRKQEFSLSCQPIARVAATASFDDVYFTANTVRSADQGNFFAISGTFANLQASVQHVYSRESTGSFKVESIVLSLMNSKHVSGTSGMSAILKVSPMEVAVNAKQLQDFMLFREIWLPREMGEVSPSTPGAKLVTETSQGHLVQRYQQVAATAAFPWTATISISSLNIVVDLGQSLGRSTFSITDFWMSSKKTSDWEQNLCLGLQSIGMDSTGRMSGFVTLRDFKLRTSIKWPEREQALNETPLVQASVGFSQFRVKAAFDYQAFLIADITSLDFLMYNVRRSREGTGDRLVAIFDGEAVQIFGTTSSAAQGVALYQAFLKLVQERKANLESSLKEIERFMKRKSVSTPVPAAIQRLGQPKPAEDDVLAKSPISLDTDVVVTLKALNLGVFPSTFADHQVFKMEALNAQARFAASIEERRIHSILGLTLGQLRIGLAGVRTTGAPKTLSELSVEDVVQSATGSRGGTILKVPQVEAVMQTWQRPDSKQIDYIFKSAFEGKVEVGWNYSRISFIRGMWATHAKTLARTWGKELPSVTAIRVTGVPESMDEQQQKQQKKDEKGENDNDKKQANKITAEVKVPQSKYQYTALEPPIIETPQLRDMGEATPPLEWIGLHRDRLPNLTHQIVIVSLLELAGEVEDAYGKILGSS